MTGFMTRPAPKTSMTLAAIRLIVIVTALCIVGSASRAETEPEISMAIRRNDVARVKQLIAAGANVNERDEGAQQTPLMRAADAGDPGIALLLLAHGAHVNASDDEGTTALMIAARRGDDRMVRLLMSAGALPDLRDGHGASALDLARTAGRKTVMKTLGRCIAVTASVQKASATPAKLASNRAGRSH